MNLRTHKRRAAAGMARRLLGLGVGDQRMALRYDIRRVLMWVWGPTVIFHCWTVPDHGWNRFDCHQYVIRKRS